MKIKRPGQREGGDGSGKKNGSGFHVLPGRDLSYRCLNRAKEIIKLKNIKKHT